MKFTINQRGKSYDFFFHKEDKRNGSGMRDILTGKTYPLIKGISPKVICDVGANIGATSVFFALNYPNSSIFSFEPTSINFNLLKKNIKEFSNINAYQFGVYNENKFQDIYIDRTSPGRNSIFQNWNKGNLIEQIQLINLSQFLEEKQLGSVDILKIDTEGCELPILLSLKKYIPKIKVIYLEYHSKKDRDDIVELLKKTHTLGREVLVGGSRKKVNEKLIGEKCLEKVEIEGKSIIKVGDIIDVNKLADLRKANKLEIMVRSNNLGEVIFLSNKL